MADYYAIPTNIGEAKMANALALGIPLAITELAVGDGEGNGAKGTPVPNPEANTLISERRRAPLNSFSVDPDNGNILIAEQVIPETAGGWWIREMGLFDEDGDMIFVCNTPPTYKPQLSEGSGRTQVVRMASIVSDTAAVTLKVDPSVVLATREHVENALSAHTEEMEAKISQRTIFKSSISEIEALSLPAGTNIYLTQHLKAGPFLVKSGNPPNDPQKAIHIIMANGNYAERINFDYVLASWFGMDGTTADKKHALKAFCAAPYDKVVNVDIYTSGMANVADGTKIRRANDSVIYALGDVTLDTDASGDNQGQILEAGNNCTFTGLKIRGQNHKGNGILNSGKENVTIQLCDMGDGTGQAIHDRGGINSKYFGNELHTSLHGIQMWLTKGAKVQGNHVYQVYGGIWTAAAIGVIASGNIVHDCEDVGIDWEGGNNCHSFSNNLWNCANGALAIFGTGPQLVSSGVTMGDLTHTGNNVIHRGSYLGRTGSTENNTLSDTAALMLYSVDDVLSGPIKFSRNTVHVKDSTAAVPSSLRAMSNRALSSTSEEMIEFSGNEIFTKYTSAFRFQGAQKMRISGNEITYQGATPTLEEIKNTVSGEISNNKFYYPEGAPVPVGVLLYTDNAGANGELKYLGNEHHGVVDIALKIDQATTQRTVTVGKNRLTDSGGNAEAGIAIVNGYARYEDQDLFFRIENNEVFDVATKSGIARSLSHFLGSVSVGMGGGDGPLYRVAVSSRNGASTKLEPIDSGGAANTGLFPDGERFAVFGATTVQPQDTNGSLNNVATLKLTGGARPAG